MLASLGSAPALAEAVALLLLAGTLAFAVVRPRGLPEAVAAVPAAALAAALGILPAGRALRELVAARDGDRSRLGPRSLGPATPFVVDHAPCQVLLVWPDQVPRLDSMPPPPGRGHPPRPPHER